MDPGDARRGDLAHQQPRRVLLTCSQALPDVGGVAVVVDREIRALAGAGHQVTLVTSRSAGSSAAPEYPDSVRIVRIGSSAVLRRLGLGGPVFSWRLIPALSRELGRCDVLHAHEFLALNSVLALRLAHLRRRPSILTEHAGIQQRQARVGNWLAQLAYQTLGRTSVRAAGRCVVVSARVADDLRRLAQPGKRIDFVPVAIDRQLFRPPAQASGNKPGPGSAGRPTAAKCCSWAGWWRRKGSRACSRPSIRRMTSYFADRAIRPSWGRRAGRRISAAAAAARAGRAVPRGRCAGFGFARRGVSAGRARGGGLRIARRAGL